MSRKKGRKNRPLKYPSGLGDTLTMLIRIQMLPPFMTSQVGTGRAAVATTRQAERAEHECSLLRGTQSERVRRWQGSNVLKRFCVGVQRREEAVEPSGMWLHEGREKRGAETKEAKAVLSLG